MMWMNLKNYFCALFKVKKFILKVISSWFFVYVNIKTIYLLSKNYIIFENSILRFKQYKFTFWYTSTNKGIELCFYIDSK